MLKVNGDICEYTDEMTVKGLLQAKNYTFPLLIVKINGTVIPRNRFADTIIPDGSNVQVIHLMSGG